MPDYLPRREGGRVEFARQLSRALVDSPGAYGVSPPEAEAYRSLYEQAAEAYRISRVPSTRTAVTVRAKDNALGALVKETRLLVRRVRAYVETAGNAEGRAVRLSRVGLRETSRSRARLRVPAAPPNLWVSPTMGGGLRLEVRDPAHAQRKAMPRGAMLVEVHVRVRPRGAADWLPWRKWLAERLTAFEVDTPPGARSGDTVELAVCWLSPTCEAGPTSLPVRIELGPVYAMRVRGVAA